MGRFLAVIVICVALFVHGAKADNSCEKMNQGGQEPGNGLIKMSQEEMEIISHQEELELLEILQNLELLQEMEIFLEE